MNKDPNFKDKDKDLSLEDKGSSFENKEPEALGQGPKNLRLEDEVKDQSMKTKNKNF